MRILKNIIALLACLALGILVLGGIKFMIVVTTFLVGVWLYLDFAFSQNDISDEEIEQILKARDLATNSIYGMTAIKFDKAVKDNRKKEVGDL